MKRALIVGLSLLSGCASLRPKGQIDAAVLKDLFCSGREASAREYLIQKGFRLPDVTERIERVRKECGFVEGAR